MTTIATDGKTIAADGLRPWNGEIRGLAHKKVRVVDKKIYALSGDTPLFEPLIAWHQAGAEPDKMPKKEGADWTLLVIDQKGLHKVSHLCPYPEWFDPPFAIGAGAEYALGAMWAGATPIEAVTLVAERTIYTGGEITVIDIAEALGLQDVLACPARAAGGYARAAALTPERRTEIAKRAAAVRWGDDAEAAE